MKIGIVTVYFADYGSFFHTMSLYNYLESLGHDCELVSYSIRRHYSWKLNSVYYFEKLFPKPFQKMAARFVPAYNTFRILKRDLEGVSISPNYSCIQELEDRYDCIVIGSDELWSATNPTINFVPAYFGLGITKPHFSYATSGITLKDPSPELRRLMKEGFDGFCAISARDRITCSWVEELTDKKCTEVLDPTLLYPYFADEGAADSDYIAVYGEHFSTEQVHAITAFAKLHNKKLRAISWRHEWCDEFATPSCAEEVQREFANSFYCMSSTFHGTIFSILHKRNFTCFTSSLRGLKVKTLLEKLGAEDRLFAGGEIVDKPVDYAKLYESIAALRVSSESYMASALKAVESKG